MTISPELWRNLFGVLSFALAIGIVVGMFVFEIPEGNREVAFTVLGVAIGWATAVMNYHFGSSSGSTAKTDLLTAKKY